MLKCKCLTCKNAVTLTCSLDEDMAYLETSIPNQRRRKLKWIFICLLVVIVFTLIAGISYIRYTGREENVEITPFAFDEVPAYSETLICEINNGIPFFSQDEITTETYESYSNLDYLGRCGAATACLSIELMPTEERESIGMIKPSGWHTVRYDDLIDDKYLYNRCHLIAYMLSGENDNDKNLITGTRYLNINGMLGYEYLVADYITSTQNHVMYRVSPVFVNDELLARGVLMEAYSVEDGGEGIQFCVFVYNVQPGISIDYSTGDSARQ